MIEEEGAVIEGHMHALWEGVIQSSINLSSVWTPLPRPQGHHSNLAVASRQTTRLATLTKCATELTTAQLLQLHSQLLLRPLPPPLRPDSVAVKLILAYAAHRRLSHANLVFSHLPNPNLYAYNTLLKSHAHNNSFLCVLRFFNAMLASPSAPAPDDFTFTSVIKACSALVLVVDGCKVHGVVVKVGCHGNLFVQNSLVDMYFKFGEGALARRVFDEMAVRDVVSWNTLINGYSIGGDVGKARKVFDGMIERSVVSWSAMIVAYARSGDVDTARDLFDQMPMRNVVSWNAMIACYAQNEKFSDCIRLFQHMQQVAKVMPDDATLVSVLSACAHLGALDLGKWIDNFVNNKRKMTLNLFLGNALSDMYAKCGAILDAKRIFHSLKERDVITWTIIINGLAMYGFANEAFDFFENMVKESILPNDITFMGLLSACTHVGLVDKGLESFHQMKEKYGISPKIEHYGCVVDLLSRAGRLEEAETLINKMPIAPNAIVWGALLGGCRTYKDAVRGERVVQRILQLDPDHSGSYVYLANVYALMGRLDDAARCRLKMRTKKVNKVPGCSWIEVNSTVHEFFKGDQTHPLTDQIYLKIRELRQQMKLAGYTPMTDLVSHNVDEEEKEDILSTHSEKLAIAFGLISTADGSTIRIAKNLRVCSDCHEAAKIISKLVTREIVLRDRNRFHMFKEGRCSCNNYW